MTQALLLIDFQNDYFLGGKWTLHNMEAAAGNAKRLLNLFREQGKPVVFVRHEFPGDDAPFFVPGSEGAEIHNDLSPQGNEPIVLKNQINCFHETNLKQILDDSSIDNLLVVGAMSHMCIDGATRAASDMGYQCAIAHDACATHDQEFNGIKVPAEQVHAAYMAALGFAYAKVASTDELIAEL